MIEKDPNDLESLHSYINSIQEEKAEKVAAKNTTLAASKSYSNLNSKPVSKQEGPF